MLSKRKALIGWLVYTGAKPVAKQALKQGVKSVVKPGKSGKKKLAAGVGTVVVAAGATAGALMFWRSRKGDAGEPSET